MSAAGPDATPTRMVVSVFYLMANRNQRDLAIDLKSEEGRETIYTLIRDKGYDVIIENFRPGVYGQAWLGI